MVYICLALSEHLVSVGLHIMMASSGVSLLYPASPRLLCWNDEKLNPGSVLPGPGCMSDFAQSKLALPPNNFQLETSEGLL